MADSPPAAIHGRCGQSPLRAAPFVTCVLRLRRAKAALRLFVGWRSRDPHTRRPPACRGYAPSAP